MDIRNKEEFEFFMQRAIRSLGDSSKSDDSYIELYNMLLRCFIHADVDMDGRIGAEEFPRMIEEAAQLPRKFGYQWWGEDKYELEEDRIKNHEQMFHMIDENNDGAVSFDEWLAFSLQQYQTRSSELPLSLDQLDQDNFVSECRLSKEPGSESHRRVYWFHWQCFQAADLDRDGMVSSEEFDTMVNRATAAQRRLGLPLPLSTECEKEAAFKQVDENDDGTISFDEWLKFASVEIMDKVATS